MPMLPARDEQSQRVRSELELLLHFHSIVLACLVPSAAKGVGH